MTTYLRIRECYLRASNVRSRFHRGTIVTAIEIAEEHWHRGWIGRAEAELDAVESELDGLLRKKPDGMTIDFRLLTKMSEVEAF